MKKFIYISVLCFIYFINCKTKSPVLRHRKYIFDTITVNCNIKRLDSLADLYIIYAKKDSQWYKILSDKKDSPYCQKVNIGDNYNLKIVSLFPEGIDFSLSNKNPHLGGMYYKGGVIDFERDSINDLFQALNLDGLCIKDE